MRSQQTSRLLLRGVCGCSSIACTHQPVDGDAQGSVCRCIASAFCIQGCPQFFSLDSEGEGCHHSPVLAIGNAWMPSISFSASISCGSESEVGLLGSASETLFSVPLTHSAVKLYPIIFILSCWMCGFSILSNL